MITNKDVKEVRHRVGDQQVSALDCDKIVKKWQTVTTTDLPNLFYAYNNTSKISERVIRFKLGGSNFQTFKSLIESFTNPMIRIHLGANQDYVPGPIPDQPPLTPLFQIFEHGTNPEDWANTFRMEWAPYPIDGHLLQSTAGLRSIGSPTSVDSANQIRTNHLAYLGKISSQTSNLFIENWGAHTFSDLASLFEAPAPYIVCRVKFYEFNFADGVALKEALAKTLMQQPEAAENNLYLYLSSANSHHSIKHPFSFRPILSLSETIPAPVPEESASENSLIEVEFSNPCPPFC